MNKQLQVAHIEHEGDRLVIYGCGYEKDPIRYHVVAKPNEEVNEGDTIEYEPYGFNFGWFVSIVMKAHETGKNEEES